MGSKTRLLAGGTLRLDDAEIVSVTREGPRLSIDLRTWDDRLCVVELEGVSGYCDSIARDVEVLEVVDAGTALPGEPHVGLGTWREQGMEQVNVVLRGIDGPELWATAESAWWFIDESRVLPVRG